jgi:tripartite-type tricarboxylate transporter receptor subunit TctC
MGYMTAAALAGVLAIATVSSPVCADGAADAVAAFYRNKTLEIDVGTGPGGGYDANARLIAAHLGLFIPGNPKIVVDNLPGGGGIRAANALFNTAPRDGSVIGTFSNAMITEPLLGTGQALFEPAKMTWIGSASREDGVCVASAKSGVRAWSDVLRKEIVVGAAAPGTTTFMYPVMLANLFGAKFKIVSGYPDGGQIDLALERGEIQSVCQTWSSLKLGRASWLRDHFVYPFVALGLGRLADLPRLPSVMELAESNEQRQILKVALAPTLAGRPFAAPPGIPADRAEALRKAFLAMTRDPAFLTAAKNRRMDIEPESGADIESLVKEIYNLPAATIAETKRMASIELQKK